MITFAKNGNPCMMLTFFCDRQYRAIVFEYSFQHVKLYVGGEFYGGADIVHQSVADGTLKSDIEKLKS